MNEAAILKMTGITVEDYKKLTPAERRRKIRKALGDSAEARSFVRRLMPEFYDDVYGTKASARSAVARSGRLRVKSR